VGATRADGGGGGGALADAEPDPLAAGATLAAMPHMNMYSCPGAHFDRGSGSQLEQSCLSVTFPVARRLIPEQGRLSAHLAQASSSRGNFSRTWRVHDSVDTRRSICSHRPARAQSASGVGVESSHPPTKRAVAHRSAHVVRRWLGSATGMGRG
jgi:hypothetical protein